MSITAKEVNELRQITGAGMMDCKKALTESEGDFEKAIEILRKKGQKVSASRADRDAKEGSIFSISNSDNSAAVLIELNCETDFVARNEDFVALGNNIVKTAFDANPASLEALLALPMDGKPIQDHLTDAMGRIGEKIAVRNYARQEGDKVIVYIHPGARVGVLVSFTGVGSENIMSIGRDVAMQVAAMRPIAVDKDGVSTDVVNKEIEIGKEQVRAEGKPEAMLEKIALGKLNKFYTENTLLNQEFVKDTSKTVGAYIKEANPNLKVKSFVRMQLGIA